MKNLRRALSYFRPDASRLVVVLLLMLAGIKFNVLKPWPLAIIVDSIFGTKPLPGWSAGFLEKWDKAMQITILSLAMLVLYVGHGALQAIQNSVSIKIGLRGLSRVRTEVFSWLQRLSLRFHQGASSGDLIYRASWDTYAFQTLFQQGFVTFATAFLSLIVMLFVMAQLNATLTLVAACLVPLLLLTIKFFGKRMSERTSTAQQADSKVTSLVQQAIAAMALIQSYTREEHEKKRHAGQVTEAEEKRILQHESELVYWFGIAAVFGVGAALITWLGAKEVMEGRLTVGQLLVFLSYLTQLFEPLNQLSHVGVTISGALAGTKRVFEILDTPEEVNDVPIARPVQSSKFKVQSPGAGEAPLTVQGNIEFADVSFGYEKGREILHDINFSVRAGESVAIVGPSGAGKTTLLSLLPRFFDPEKGSIKLDGADLRELRLKDLRSQIALVLQQPIILPTTVAENIGYGKPGASTDEIEAAARAANAHDFIQSLPKKYETIVGDGATRLSIGEQQRLNLARAFLKDAPILLLDEPTNALDVESEMLIVESLQKLVKGRTTLIVAHRLRTIQHVKRILVIENGRLTQAGTREDLLKSPGYFGRMTSVNSNFPVV